MTHLPPNIYKVGGVQSHPNYVKQPGFNSQVIIFLLLNKWKLYIIN